MTERQARDRFWRLNSRDFDSRVGTHFVRNDIFFVRFRVTLGPGVDKTGVEGLMATKKSRREELYDATLRLIEDDAGSLLVSAAARA